MPLTSISLGLTVAMYRRVLKDAYGDFLTNTNKIR